MSVRLSGTGTIVLEGDCPSEDAAALLEQLLGAPAAAVDWTGCESAHCAVIQVLLAAGRKLLGPPAGASLRSWVQPALERATC